MIERRDCVIVSNTSLAAGIYRMVINWPDAFPIPLPGQFVNLYCRDDGRLLPRPISVCRVERGRLHLVYAVAGAGTAEFSRLDNGATIELLGPLGNGYDLSAITGRALLVAGGVGTPPMVELAAQLKKRGVDVVSVCGFRRHPFLIEDLAEFGRVLVATEDGSTGFFGTVVELLDHENLHGDVLFSCGPLPLLKAVKAWGCRQQIPTWLSVEERMGCGFGGCVGCAVRAAEPGADGAVYKKVCRDGPVFAATEVLL